jgi:hypothetical protein
MANYPIPGTPVYNPAVRQLENTDPANATTIFNPTVGQMVMNTVAVKVTADGAATSAANALAEANQNTGDITDLDGRLSQVEDSLQNGITANKFVVTFDTLNGLTLTNGIWNTTARRLEC